MARRQNQKLTWNEVHTRLQEFVAEHREDWDERGQGGEFMRDLLFCYGLTDRRLRDFEARATRASSGRLGFVDGLVRRKLLIEMKRRGVLSTEAGRAETLAQAQDYLHGGDLAANEVPAGVLLCDFATFCWYPVDRDTRSIRVSEGHHFSLEELPERPGNVLSYLANFHQVDFSNKAQELASVEAAKLVAGLYEVMTESTVRGASEVEEAEEGEDAATALASKLLTRLLFLMFGDDAGLWAPDLFRTWLEEETKEDGSDLGRSLTWLFEVMDTPEARREALGATGLVAEFPYVNGGIFSERLSTRAFDTQMRRCLLAACDFDWSRISPAVFGSLFQAVKSKAARRAAGEHYTAEHDIMKVLGPLFLEEFRAELAAARTPAKVRSFLSKLERARFLDPACGSGNFLVVAYRELRRLEREALERLHEMGDLSWGDELTNVVRLSAFHGFEISWWPARIAETALFLEEFRARAPLAVELGIEEEVFPLKIRADIHHVDALDADWDELLGDEEGVTWYVFGNPPFLGPHSRTKRQLAQLRAAWGTNETGRLDFVTAWHAKTLALLGEGRKGEFAFVTTNSIVQGDQVPRLFGATQAAGWRIKFAHRTFPWRTETAAKDMAAVHCVIVGFTRNSQAPAVLFTGETGTKVPNINAYLVAAPDALVEKRSHPLSPDIRPSALGNMAKDGGNLIVEAADYEAVAADPIAAKYLRPFVGGDELLQGKSRWCLWMADDFEPTDVSRSGVLRSRIEAVRQMRLDSSAPSTRAHAQTAHLFVQRGPKMESDYLCIPAITTEARAYLPCARLPRETIPSNTNFVCVDPDGLQFAVVSSGLFMLWQKTVGGRLEERIRFSGTITWNNFPLPTLNPTSRAKLIAAGQGVLAARALHPERSLAQHYKPGVMDPALLAAHRRLDAEMAKVFGLKAGATELEQQRRLFELYAELTTKG